MGIYVCGFSSIYCTKHFNSLVLFICQLFKRLFANLTNKSFYNNATTVLREKFKNSFSRHSSPSLAKFHQLPINGGMTLFMDRNF